MKTSTSSVRAKVKQGFSLLLESVKQGFASRLRNSLLLQNVLRTFLSATAFKSPADTNVRLTHGGRLKLCLTLISLLSALAAYAVSPPVVSNVRASQRTDNSKKVDIDYGLADSDSPTVRVSLEVFNDGAVVPAQTLVGLGFGPSVVPGTGKRIVWSAGVDWNGQMSSKMQFRVTASDDPVSASMALIPAGTFQMGNSTNSVEGNPGELPVHTVYVSAFYMDRYEVTKQLWDDVRAWGLSNGYTDLPVGSGKAANHPVQTITWYSMVKWCNARSEKEGLTPVYCTNDAQTTVYKTGSVNVTNAQVRWNAGGYRLPTEAEWEKASRGGLSAQRFPWGATISHSQANYYVYSSNGTTNYYTYDISPTRNYHPSYVGTSPYTSPVGAFVPNGYELYDMAGNVWEWCWDWYGSTYYSTSPASDPQGPPPGSNRVLRGGSWRDYAFSRRAIASTPSGSGLSAGRSHFSLSSCKQAAQKGIKKVARSAG